MEVEKLCSANAVVKEMLCCSVLGPAQNYIFLLLILSGTLLGDVDVLSSPFEMNKRFLLGDVKQATKVEENKDAGESDEENEDESDGDEEDSDDEVETNGDAGSDDEDDDDDSEDDDEDDDDEEEED